MDSITAINRTIVPSIGRAGKMIELYLTRIFQEENLDLTFKQWLLMKIILHHDGENQDNLARITNRHKGSLTRILGTMEDKNLIARIPDSNDNRINRIFATKKGHQLFKDANPYVLQAFNNLQDGISQAEIDSLIKILDKVKGNIENTK